MGFVLQPDAVPLREALKRPYRVVFWEGDRQRMRRFKTLGAARSFQAGRRFGANSRIEFRTKAVKP